MATMMFKKRFKYVTYIFIVTITLLQILSFFVRAEDIIRSPGPNLLGHQVPGADPFNLLFYNKDVQRDIGVTKQQLENLLQIEKFFRSELYNLSYDKGKENTKKIDAHIERAQQGICKILTKKQIERLNQILLQINGPCFLLKNNKLSNKLQFTSQQKLHIEKICGELTLKNKNIGSVQNSEKNKIENNRQKMIKEVVETNNYLYNLFNAKQKIIYEKEIGTLLKLKKDAK